MSGIVRCRLCGTPVAYRTKPPNTCRRCRDADRAAVRANREAVREAARAVGEALARLRARAPDLAPKVQALLAETVLALEAPDAVLPTPGQAQARRDRLWPDREETLARLVGEATGSGRPPR